MPMEIQQIETSESTDKQQQLTMFYDSLDEDTANYLKAKEYEIVQIGNSYLTKMGKIFKEAQDRLSKNGYGTFGKWIEAISISKDFVYRQIQKYELIIANCDNQNAIETIEKMPKSLSYEISKPSAPAKLVQDVMDGKITKHKDYMIEKAKIEAEAKAKYEAELAEKDKLLQQAKNDETLYLTRVNNLNGHILELKNAKEKAYEYIEEKDKQIRKLKAEVKTEIIYEESPELQKALWEAEQEKERLKNETEKANDIINTLQLQLNDISVTQNKRDELERQVNEYKRQIQSYKEISEKFNIEINAIRVIKELINKLDLFLTKESMNITLQRIENNEFIKESKIELEKRIKTLYNWILTISQRMEIEYE